jgi:undecaprenyl-diphosphatase
MTALDTFFILVSDWGMALPLALLLYTRDAKTIIRAFIAAILALGVSDVLKGVIARPRPFIAGDALLIGDAPMDEWSLPSKHASISLSLATNILLSRRVLGWISLAAAALISYSRVYLGVHYWSDVIAGAILGAAIAFATDKVFARFEQRNNPRKR